MSREATRQWYLPKLHDLALCEGLGAQLCIGLVFPEAQIIGGHNEPVAIHHLCKPDRGEGTRNNHSAHRCSSAHHSAAPPYVVPFAACDERKDCCVQHRAIYSWCWHLSQGFWLVLEPPFWSAKGEVIILVCLAGVAEGADFVCIAAHHGGLFNQSQNQI